MEGDSKKENLTAIAVFILLCFLTIWIQILRPIHPLPSISSATGFLVQSEQRGGQIRDVGWMGEAGHVEGLDEEANVFGEVTAGVDLPHRLPLVAHRAHPFVAAPLLLLYLLRCRAICTARRRSNREGRRQGFW